MQGFKDYKWEYGKVVGVKANVDEWYLKDQYSEFMKKYKQYVEVVIYGDIQKGLESYKMKLKDISSKIKKNQVKEWLRPVKDSIYKAMAYIFAMWTLMNSDYFKEMQPEEGEKGKDEEGKEEDKDAMSYLFKPHPAQIIAIMRLLGIGNYETKGFLNNLVQIGTGKGKSVTIAVSAIILALLGYDVSCACHSEYLSKRDQTAFQKLYEFLQVDEQIIRYLRLAMRERDQQKSKYS